jgi:tetratricopeptide (TPR) repeat protein
MPRPAPRLLVACVFLLASGTPLAASPDSPFQRGLEAFRAGNYTAARDHFEAARQAGMDKPALYYNLGAVYYRLGQYRKARKAFARLTDEPGSAALAHYNLGLVARKLDDPATARRHFRIASRTSDDPKIQRLAREALGREEESDPLAGVASVGLGYDDKVILDPGEIVGSSDTDDFFVEALAGGSYQLRGSREQGLQLKGSVYHLDYFDIDAFDQTFLRLGPEWDTPVGDWAIDLAAYGDLIYLDGEPFEWIATGEVDGTRPLAGDHALRLRYRLSYLDGQSPFGYLTGIRHRAEAEWRYDDGTREARAGYELEYNDREDFSEAGTFTSVSPTRHELELRAGREWAQVWEAEVRATYRFSRYHDAHVASDGTATTREETRLRARAAISRELPWELRAFAEFQFTDNDSNIDFYDYTANVYTIGLERYF